MWPKGRPRPPETRARISEALKGRPAPSSAFKLGNPHAFKPGNTVGFSTRFTAASPYAFKPGNTVGGGSVRHGHRRRGQPSPTYTSWKKMRERCGDPDDPWYGSRGITVCERWQSFENFLADMGERPEGKTLDRIDPDGNYEPGNVRWATPLEQTANRRKTTGASMV